MPKAAVMHDTSACVNHGYPSAPNPKPLKNNIHLNTTPPLRSQDPKKQLRGSTIEGFKHITNTLQNTPSYTHWKKNITSYIPSKHPITPYIQPYVLFCWVWWFLGTLPSHNQPHSASSFLHQPKGHGAWSWLCSSSYPFVKDSYRGTSFGKRLGLCTAPFGKVYAYRPCYQV